MRILTVITAATALSLFALAGCGGESFESDDDPQAGEGGSGTGGTGKSGSGGASGSGKGARGGTAGSGVGGSGWAGTAAGSGNSSSGGDGGSGVVTGGAGGRGGAGGSGGQSAGAGAVAGAGEAGSGGEGGQPYDLCLLAADSGPCEAAFERWFFNAERGVCQPFSYGGCEGNENNFETLEKCHGECSGHGLEDPTSCNNSAECVVTAANCCGSNPSPTIADVTAVNAASLDDFTAICQLVDCTSTLGPISHFGATCSDGHCLAFDIRNTEMTACSEPADCRLRNGLQCCESCTNAREDYVALRNDADLQTLVCGGAPILCAACEPAPAGLAADCLEGNCEVIELSVPFEG